jgi:hypothetical protein
VRIIVLTWCEASVLALTARIVPCMFRIMATVGSRSRLTHGERMPWPARITGWSGM